MSSTIIDGKEIIVQAELSAQNLFNTPSSISILNKRALENRNGTHFQNIIDLIPNLNYSSATSRPRYFQIRGIGEKSLYSGEGPPNFSVGFVLDDMDLSGLGMVGLLYDIDQVEVFKGPQSTIYGSNAMAGLISLHSVDPTNDWISVFGTSSGEKGMASGTQGVTHCGTCSAQWGPLFGDEVLESKFQDGHYAYSVVAGGGSGSDVYPPVLYVVDVENAVDFNNVLEP